MDSSRKVGVLLLPGSNCHKETKRSAELVGLIAEIVFHLQLVDGSRRMADYAGWLIPGGFSWGDHLGSGRVAGFALGDYLMEFAMTGRPMAGICNGDQILFESGLFSSPEGISGGALVQNECGRFVSGWVNIMALPGSPWTEGFEGATLRMPVAHREGRWYIPDGVPGHITPVFQYTRDGIPTEEHPYNPSGTPKGICGVAQGNILGMMPHPERAMHVWQGSTAGQLVFRNFAKLVSAS